MVITQWIVNIINILFKTRYSDCNYFKLKVSKYCDITQVSNLTLLFYNCVSIVSNVEKTVSVVKPILLSGKIHS